MLSDEIWDMDESVIQPTRTKVPWTVIALIALWTLAQLLHYLETRGPDVRFPGGEPEESLAFTMADVLSFVYGFLIVALISYGLLRSSRFVWIVAFVWQGLQAGFGLITFVLNDYELAAYTSFAGIPLYGIVMPFGVAVISFVLLLLPATQRWIRED